MQEALLNILVFHSVDTFLHSLRKRGVLKVTRLVMGIIMVIAFSGIFVYQTNHYIQNKEPNYFELLELENTTPSPMLVKKKYKEIMN